jgi:hypothetical protein
LRAASPKGQERERRASNNLPVNPWLNEECKEARRNYKNKNNESLKTYKQVVKLQKSKFIKIRQELL